MRGVGVDVLRTKQIVIQSENGDYVVLRLDKDKGLQATIQDADGNVIDDIEIVSKNGKK